LAVRWILDQGATTALWGARHPAQLRPIEEVFGWSLDAAAKAEIDRVLQTAVTDPVGPPEFMAPPPRRLGKKTGNKIKTAVHAFEGNQTYTEKRGRDFVLRRHVRAHERGAQPPRTPEKSPENFEVPVRDARRQP
jgi:hypothetical protein